MDIKIDRSSGEPIYRQVVRNIEEMIRSGALPEGFRLPPERRLAEALGVNRSTVLSAYRELKALGLVDAHVGRGTAVLRPPEPLPGAVGVPWRQLFRESVARSHDPILADLLALTERRDVISFSIGLPAPEHLPMDTIGRITSELLHDVGPPLLLHCPTEGHTPFRESLAGWVTARGIQARTSNVLVLTGSQQGLDLVARVFLDPGDVVVVEEPTYLGALQAFRVAQARILAVPVDRDGMRTDILASVLEHHRPKLIYTLPTYQNPSGAVMSLRRRRHLLELASRWNVPILEDEEKIRCNVTMIFSSTQAFLAMKADASYVSIVLSRLDAVANESSILVEDTAAIKTNYGFDSEIIAGSMKTQNQVLSCLRAGIDIATVNEQLFFQMFKHPLTETGLAGFAKDWEKVPK